MSEPIRLMDDARQRDQLIGKFVRVEGIMSQYKQPQIAGVDVETSSDVVGQQNENLRGTFAYAEGVLVRLTVTPDEVSIYDQSRGPGVFYRIIDPYTGRIAVAKSLR